MNRDLIISAHMLLDITPEAEMFQKRRTTMKSHNS
jgi:hypothetical protein